MKLIESLLLFIRRDTLEENESAYFLIGLRWLFCLMIVYYLLYIGICMIFHMQDNILSAIPWFIMMTAGFFMTYRYSDKSMFLIYMFLIISWTLHSIYSYGWNTGGQQFLIPLLVLVFFCVHYSTKRKVLIMLGFLAFRLGLFMYCLNHEPKSVVGYTPSVVLQVLNSVFLFLGMTCAALNFSSNIQKAEKKLMSANAKLRAQAGTDSLTGLPNRREMTSIIQKWRNSKASSNFALAMADIDFFKRVNDTWGHECGDEVLISLADLFQEKLGKKGYACRWGGEEFLFFFPEMNLDEAKFEVEELLAAVRRLRISYGNETIQVTMTFGIEENDYTSDLHELIGQADEKLYYGKDHGRNRVIS